MRNVLKILLCGSLLALVTACASGPGNQSDTNPIRASSSVSGVLIDNACAPKMMSQSDPETAAAGHTKACATADACVASGYAVISGKDVFKFDDNGNKLAKDFLAKTDKTDNLRVVVDGIRNGNTIAVTDIHAG